MSDFNIALSKALALPTAKRRELIEHLKASIGISGGKQVERAVAEEAATTDYITDAIRRLLIKKGVLIKNGSVSAMIRALETTPKYSADSKQVKDWLAHHVGKVSDRQLDDLADTLVLALYQHLHRVPYYQEQGIGPHALLNNISKIPTAIDGELPGYAASGLLRMMVRAMPERKRLERVRA